MMTEVCLIDLIHYTGGQRPEEYDPRKAASILNGRLDEWERAEQLGYDGLFLTEHHFTSYNLTPSPNVMLAAASQRCRRMRLGVMANIVPFHQPVRLAEECAMLDLLTEGRLEMGFGRGVDEPEFRRFNMPFEEARPRFEESIELMVKAWDQQTFSHKGRFFELGEATLYPRPLQQPHPKIWITANSPSTIEWAAHQGFSMSNLFLPPAQTREAFDLFWSTAGKAGHVRGPEHTAVARHTVVADSDEEALQIARNNFEVFARLFKDAAVPADIDSLPDDYATWRTFFRLAQGFEGGFDQVVDAGLVIAGSPATVRDNLLEQLETIGCGHFLAVMNFGYITPAEVGRSIELFGREVLPAVHSMEAATSAA